MAPQQRARAAQRVLVVAANIELQERGLLKHARIAGAISAALRERGTDELTARLGAEVGMLAFSIAVERWMGSDDDEPFPVHAAAALNDLQWRAAELDSRPARRQLSERRRQLGQSPVRLRYGERYKQRHAVETGSTASSAIVPSHLPRQTRRPLRGHPTSPYPRVTAASHFLNTA
jgi:hypothetical protein